MCPVTGVNAWLREVSRDGATSSPHTLRAHAYNFLDFLTFLESRNISLTEATDADLLEYRDVQDQNISSHTKHYLSRRTINARLVSIGKCYNFLFKEGLIAKNPVRYKTIKFVRPADVDRLAHLGRVQTREVPAVTFERLGSRDIKWRPHSEITQWLNSIEDWSDKLVAKLLYRLGVRREELATLQLLELPDRGSINPTLPEVSFNITGKGRKRRLVYMSMRDFNELHDYIDIVRAGRVRKTASRHDYIFVDRKGAPLKPAQINRLFARVSKHVGIHITPHMMRHSFAVTAIQYWKSIGVSHPEQLLKARLGHSCITTTQIYMHMTDEMKAQEAHANATLIEMLIRGEDDAEES
jgi:site-specific recombinase XerD